MVATQTALNAFPTRMINNSRQHDLHTILNATHENKWVAIAPDYSRVLAAADKLSDLARLVTDPERHFPPRTSP